MFMVKRGILSDVCSIVHPLPDIPDEDSTPEEVLDATATEYTAAEVNREVLLGQLTVAWEESDVDPLLAEIASAREEIRAAEQRLKRLIAYGREFVEPRPYTLDSLAQAAGMSVSGVRTAYDDEEIYAVARIIGAKLRRREATDAAATETPGA
uniref:hypothetical protein n=1 Tax=Actinokineospora sp. CA-119265 TaxID=3239890 RepID=UPI003F492C2C